ncbi:MAG: hypothetical protein U1E15_11640 [Hyphomicrobiales bacterium]
MADAALLQVIAASTLQPVHEAVRRCAEELRKDWPEAAAILAYGSVLRNDAPSDTLIDFYVLVQSRAGLGRNPLLRAFGHLVPPNVYYGEAHTPSETWRYKYAVVTLDDFAAWMLPTTGNPYFWARFAQPSRLIWQADEAARVRTLSALGEAARTAFRHAVALAPSAQPLAQWQALFEATYQTELRPESAGRAQSLVASNADYFESLSAALAPVQPLAAAWPAKRWQGKLWSLARLFKATFTFRGGVDYAAWKIERHSGVKVEVTDWHRRHPVLSALLFWRRLRRSKALK